MMQETYNSRLYPNPENISIGSLLRVKKHCRNNITIRNNGEYGILAPNNKGKYITHDVVFPNGTRCIYMPLNWEVVSHAR